MCVSSCPSTADSRHSSHPKLGRRAGAAGRAIVQLPSQQTCDMDPTYTKLVSFRSDNTAVQRLNRQPSPQHSCLHTCTIRDII